MKKILFTPGEPAGIGFELAVKAAQTQRNYQFIAVADPEALSRTASQLQLPLNIQEYHPNKAERHAKSSISVIPIALPEAVTPGKLNVANAGYVLNSLTQAANLCITGEADALVTGPVQKSIINESGLKFSGHTEFFADLSKTNKVVMMLATPSLRVALATTHLPLKDVSAAITKDSLRETIQILINDLNTKFGLTKPRILVCGLNPHAGENGHLGSEEIDTIIPVLNAFNKRDVELIGPLPADTLFTPNNLNNTDAVLAMYHDQGLPVLKSQGFGEAVNITLGLPFIRTSVDHGTALNIAGQGMADIGSLNVALQYAEQLSAVKNSN